MRLFETAALAGALVFAVALGQPTVARAATPTPEDLETARDLVKQGREARARGDMTAALEKFKAAHAAGQTPVTGIELARTYAAVAMLVEAREVALSIGRMPVAPDETQRSAEARAEAAKLAEDLRPRIPSVTIRLEKRLSDASVTIDDEALPQALIGEPRKVNPGSHTITLSSGGRVVASKSLTVKESDSVVVSLAPTAAPAPNLTQSGGFSPPAPPPTAELRSPLSPPRAADASNEGVPDNLVLGASFTVVPHLFLPANENPPDTYKPIFGVTAGMTFEAGGAISTDFDVMIRALVSFGDRGKPSYVVGAGPAFSYAATRWLWLGAALLAGRAETAFAGLPYSTDWVLAGTAEVSFAVYQRSHGQWLLSFQPGYYFVNERNDNPLFFFPVSFGYRSF